MKTCLHLYTETSKHSVFYQIVNEDIDLQKGEYFEYGNEYVSQFDSKTIKSFEQSGATIGTYEVHSTMTEYNNHWGELRYLFLKPVALK